MSRKGRRGRGRGKAKSEREEEDDGGGRAGKAERVKWVDGRGEGGWIVFVLCVGK